MDDFPSIQNGSELMNKWDPESFFKLERMVDHKYAVLVLNRPIIFPPEFLIPFWNHAEIRIVADGGGNRWYDYLKRHDRANSAASVNILCGDLDSVTPDVLKQIEMNGGEVIPTKCQDETDFTKSLKVLRRKLDLRKTSVEFIFAICQSSGRLDQIMSNVNTLFKFTTQRIFESSVSIYLLSDDSFSWLLNAGRHVIRVPESVQNCKAAWCSLIPIGQTCTNISTTGLKWNLTKGRLSFGEIVSTSNTFDGSDDVTVENSEPLLWSMNIIPILQTLYNSSVGECPVCGS